MKVKDILEASLLKKSNQLDVGDAVEKDTNLTTAKRLANSAKAKAKKGNPEEADTPSQASAGGHGSAFLLR